MSQVELPEREILRWDLHVKSIKNYVTSMEGKHKRGLATGKLGSDAVPTKASASPQRNPESGMTLQNFSELGQGCPL